MIQFPQPVEQVIRRFWTCEFTTLSKKGVPITWPVMAIYRPSRGEFVIGTPIGLPQKALNIRRDPRVALLFSEPTGSGLDAPSAVLVQGDAQAPDAVVCSLNQGDQDLLSEILPGLRRLIRAQPASRLYLGNPLARYLMDWYFMRLMIMVKPRRILLWKHGDFTVPPCEVEVNGVG